MRYLAFLIAIWLALSPTIASAQGDYGVRIPSRDGSMLLPVASRLLGSTDQDHLNRGSINSWDVSASIGTPVFAAAPGVVTTSGCYLYERGLSPILQGYGCSVQVDHSGGIVTQYGHCLENSLRVQPGQQVTQQIMLCQVGQTGKTGWPHVHFTILRNGGAYPIGNVFDIGQMHYCKFCQATNAPGAPISNAAPGQMGAGQGARGFDQRLALIVLTICCFLFWLTGKWMRYGLFFALAIYAAVLTGITYPPATTTADVGTWKTAYSLMRREEGARCVHDPVKTLKGITQGTYTRWRMAQGLGPGDVCTQLTEAQAEAIYYQYYWLESGANRLPATLAVTMFDFAVNAGPGASARGLTQCNTNVQCFNDYREVFYRSSRDFPLYGAGWLNRLARMRAITERY